MVFMGIDQSLTSTGICIYDCAYHWSMIESKKTKDTKSPTIDYTRRLMDITKEVEDKIKEFNVEVIAIEGMSFGSQGRTIFELGGLSHILRAKFIELNIPFVVIPPTTLKKFWFGKGNAKKEEMVEEAMKRGFQIPFTKNYGTKKEPNIMFDDNVVDATALCVFLQDLDIGAVGPEFINMVEYSSNEVFTR